MELNHRTTNGHICFFYNSTQERAELLAEYFRQGIASNQYCIFATNDSPPAAIKQFAAAQFDAAAAVASGSMHIFEMNQVYLQGGQFEAAYMLNNVSSFIEDAKSLGFSGLRTAGEMSWISEHPEADAEAKAYERDVNLLTAKHPDFVGLCLYPNANVFSSALTTALHTHPTLMQEERIKTNPYYQAVTV